MTPSQPNFGWEGFSGTVRNQFTQKSIPGDPSQGMLLRIAKSFRKIPKELFPQDSVPAGFLPSDLFRAGHLGEIRSRLGNDVLGNTRKGFGLRRRFGHGRGDWLGTCGHNAAPIQIIKSGFTLSHTQSYSCS